jgi:hypothetical protein
MKYIEEINNGQSFKHKEDYYIATCDFDNHNKRLCVNLSTGYPRWLDKSCIIEHIEIYTMDKDNNIINIKV